MSFVLIGLQTTARSLRAGLLNRTVPCRSIFLSSPFRDIEEAKNDNTLDAKRDTDQGITSSRDRSRVIPVETSIRYLASDAYKQTYGDDPIWKLYRRNHKGLHPPKKTRKTCIRANVVTTGNPCPLCRDEYLVLDYRNTGLLNQFISPHNGAIFSYTKTGICQKKYKQLLIAIYRAKDRGIITFDLPFREYNYSEWKPKELQAEN
ncbi:28S ribosomal protein S18b, mitochondrial [Cephus cinctus]|uniref:Small ribosomal subunit protein mS40 n=1 Tax=Cephus cinctus TaxID=211228 RepID=A0AAJ7RQ27_CEPCN|nr:28S ribosomal protein S18b, mitochondrial [Cephus cinctus]XP_024945010.1 28S ribosomal protein S18b, mitochondrial [Cephus cinctus]